MTQACLLQLGVSVRHRRGVNTEHGGGLAASRNAVAGAQIARVHEGAQLVAKLDVQRNVALWLEMEWKHCLSPSAQFYQILAWCKSQFVFPQSGWVAC